MNRRITDTDAAEALWMKGRSIFYNILSNSTDAFLGTVAVELDPEAVLPPSIRARHIACDILTAPGACPTKVDRGAPGGIRAIMSTREMFDAYGLNR